MERESNSSMDSLCRSGCGFYGSQATDGLCSICYKELLKKKQRPPSSSTSSTAFSFSGSLPTSSTLSAIATLSQSNDDETSSHRKQSEATENQKHDEKEVANALTASDQGEDKDSKPKKKNRCGICKKKLGLTGFECRCGGLYCGVHRYSDKHECTFDYRQLGAQEIRKNNPVVVGEKIQKI